VLRENGLLAAMLVAAIVLSVVLPYFATYANFLAIARTAAITGIIACGMTLVMVTGGFDLSVARVAALVGLVVAQLSHHGAVVALLVGLLVALAFGLGNGLLVQAMKINPFVVTLGAYSIAQSAALLINQGQPYSGFAPWLAKLANARVLTLPLDIWAFILVAVACEFILRATRYGSDLYALGGSALAARRAGIRVDRSVVMTYAAVSVAAGLAGVMLAARSQSADPTALPGGELTVIAAVIIGGTRLGGGVGTVWRTVLGALLLSSVTDALLLANVSPFWTGGLTGSILIMAVLADVKFARRNS
jgi:ribose/xylose/arabinose/galactoside ABC-type transport system permease subunit